VNVLELYSNFIPSWGGVMEKVTVMISRDSVISLLAGKGADTTVDLDQNGVPDSVESLERSP